MDFSQIVQDAIDIYKSNTSKVLSQDDAQEIIRAALTVRDTQHLLETAPRHLLQVLFEFDNFYNKSYYACDTISLRNILQSSKITDQSRIVLFNNFVVQRAIKDQKIHICLSFDPCKYAKDNGCKLKVFGGMGIFDTNVIDIQNKIDCIIVNSNDSNVISIVERIVRECKVNCEVYANATISGVDKYKFASKTQKLTRYKINLPHMNIHNEVARAFSAKDALDNLLARKWHWHDDRKIYKRKPERYTANFWMNSGFIDSIIKEATSVDMIGMTKDADACELGTAVQADVGAGSSYGTGGRMAGEGNHADWHGVKRMIYRKEGESSMIAIGDIYRSKMHGNISHKGASVFKVVKKTRQFVILQDDTGEEYKVEITLELPSKYIKV